MGSGWREKLLDWPVNSAEQGKGLRYIPRPSQRLNLARHGVDEEGDEDEREEEEKEEEEEALHYLRMMRCGATRVQNPGLANNPVKDSWNEERAEVILGWPDEGGVWVYNPSTPQKKSPPDEQSGGDGIDSSDERESGKVGDEMVRALKEEGFADA